jgi:cyclic-di-GMP phosphodiesterase TipF (flagellum assembly factor)
MPIVAHALFYTAYAVVATAVGAALAVIGGGSAAEATLGAIGFFAAFALTHAALSAAHAAGAVKLTEKRLTGEIEKIRQLHKEVVEDVSAVAERLDRVDQTLSEVAHARLEPPPRDDMRALEALVDRLGRSLDQRFDEVRRAAIAPPRDAARAPTPIELIREAINENRVELHLQPIMALPQRRSAFYEGFSRLKDADGRIMPPSEFLPAAEAAGLLSWIDNVLLFRALQLVRRLAQQDRRTAIFCNISGRTLSDESFFPQFLDFVSEHKDMAANVIFEIAQEAFEARTALHARAMARLADLGYRFSIDKVTRLDVDLADLERAGVRFFKVSGELLLSDLVKNGVRPRTTLAREISAADVTAVFRRYGVDIIAERIEDERTAAEILDLGVPFAQGHLFGAARAIKDSLMEETAPPKGFIESRRGHG